MALEWIGGQGDAAAALAGLKGGEVDRGAVQPEAAHGGEQRGRLAVAALRRTEGGEGRTPGGRGVPVDQGGERPARADFQQQGIGRPGERRDAVAEAHRGEQVAHPVLRIGGLLGGDPGAGDIGEERQLRRAQIDARERRGERLRHRLHHRRMEGVRGAQEAVLDPLPLQVPDEPRHGLRRTGQRRDPRRAGRREGEAGMPGEPALHLVLGERHGHHAAGRPGGHQAPAQRHQARPLFQGEDAGEAGGDVLAEAVAEQGVRPDPPAQQQAGERVLQREEGRLGERRPLQKVRGLRRAFGGAAQEGA